LSIQDTPFESLPPETISEINVEESSTGKMKLIKNKKKGKGKSKQNDSPKVKSAKAEPTDEK